MTRDALRALPAVGALVDHPELADTVDRLGRPLVVRAARTAVEQARQRILAGEATPPVTAATVAAAAEALARPSLRRAINATGVLIHTNLGRAPLPASAQTAVAEVAAGYSNVEMNLGTGGRGSRHDHLEPLLPELLGTEAAMAVNNNAGAVLLMLAAVAAGREVIVARGELVEIGGGFRIPDVMRASGAELVEVGTTNKVYVRDYEAALTERTAALLVVHRSNFALVGFTASPTLEDLAALARARGVKLLVDVGSGLLAPRGALGDAERQTAEEPRPIDVLRAGADLAAFSGDKLLGGPQAGLLAGRADVVDACKRHPLARALRIDKLGLAALEATLRLYRDGRADEIPVVRNMAGEGLAARADRLEARIRRAAPALEVTRVTAESVVGGGSLPLARLPGPALQVGPPGEAAARLLAALRRQNPPIIARLQDDRVLLDPRTLADEELAPVAAGVAAAHLEITRV